jgi:hypothetical protein
VPDGPTEIWASIGRRMRAGAVPNGKQFLNRSIKCAPTVGKLLMIRLGECAGGLASVINPMYSSNFVTNPGEDGDTHFSLDIIALWFSINSEMLNITRRRFMANRSTSFPFAMVPSGLVISQRTAAGFRPAILTNSTDPSV